MQNTELAQLAESLIKISATAQDMDDFCRRIALDVPLSSAPKSALIYQLGASGLLSLRGRYGVVAPPMPSIPLLGPTHCSLDKAVRSRVPVVVGDAQMCTHECHPRILADEDARSVLLIPVLHNNSLYGILLLTFDEPLQSSLEVTREGSLIQLSLESLLAGHWMLSENEKAPVRSLQDALLWMTSRQLEILNALEENHTSGQIAQNMHVSESTIKQELSRIFRRLGVRDRAQAKDVYHSLLGENAVYVTPSS